MIALDINSNYSDSGGGIRTYHRAKIAWFNRQRRHRYYLIVPGPKAAVRRIGPHAVRIEVYGLPLGGGYRLLLDFWRVLLILRRVRPQLVEAGDPFLTGIFCLLVGRLGLVRHRLTAFYHSDPIETWVVPWAARGWKLGWRRWLARLASGVFYSLQRRYDVTVVTSRAMEDHLRARGVRRIVRKPFGSDPVFFAPPRPLAPASLTQRSLGASGAAAQQDSNQVLRLFFVGRLGADKAADLLLDALPRIMSLPGVELTIVGRGPLEAGFAQAPYRGLHLLGYLSDRRQVAQVYAEHDVLLAPGPYETFGLAVLEAMASGLVVVGPDRGGTSELLAEAQSPFQFRSGDADDFLRAIQAVLAADLAPHAAAAQAVARRYGTWDEAIGRLVAYYEESVRGQPAWRGRGRRWRVDRPPGGANNRTTKSSLGRARAARELIAADSARVLNAGEQRAMSNLSVFFAMHDVTPFHRQRLERAERLLESWGVKKLLYLLVPNYHGAHRADQNPEFQAWCRRPRPFELQWYLHGYFHLLVPGAEPVDLHESVERHESAVGRSPITGSLAVGSPKSNEAEFSQLSAAANCDRLVAGRGVFRRCLGFDPAGFVAPKWMASQHLNPLLQELGFQWTENDRSVCDLSRRRQFSSPVITWATRSWWRKQSGLWGCPLLFSLWQRRPLLRIAMHPFDFDHPAVVDSIARIVARALQTRTQAFYPEVFSADSHSAAA